MRSAWWASQNIHLLYDLAQGSMTVKITFTRYEQYVHVTKLTNMLLSMNRLFYGWEYCTVKCVRTVGSFFCDHTILNGAQKSIPRILKCLQIRALFHGGILSRQSTYFCKPFEEPRNRFLAWRTGIRQHYLTYRPARLHRLAESIPWIFKRLQIRALFASRTCFFTSVEVEPYCHSFLYFSVLLVVGY